MDVSRIEQLRRATERMIDGEFDISVTADVDDVITRLGGALSRLGASLNRRFGELRQLLDVTSKINSGLALNEVLDHIYDAFRDVIPYDRIGCALISKDGTTVRAVWARTESATVEIQSGYDAPLKGSSLQQILDSGQPRILNDLAAYLEKNPHSQSTHRIVAEGVRSSLTCPLIAVGSPVGFLFFSSNQPGTYANLHVGSFRQIAAQVSVIVEKSRIYQELLDAQRRLEQANRQLEQLAHVDPLTGLANRRYYDLQLDKEWRRAQRSGAPMSLILLDIDRFKDFNDRYGHIRGDACLAQVGGQLKATAARGTDTTARYGGEEFVVLIGDTGPDKALQLAHKLRASVEALQIPHEASDHGHVTVSIGVAGGVPTPGMSALEMVEAADKALYRAKNEGRNRVCVAESWDVEPPTW